MTKQTLMFVGTRGVDVVRANGDNRERPLIFDEVLTLDEAGVRAIRFNLKRGGSEGVERLEAFAKRVHEIADWHVELYVDSEDLADLYDILITLPAVSIDHLGLSRADSPVLLRLVERGTQVKATGFGRVDLDVEEAIKDICAANPHALMFGTDLPSTRAPRPYSDEDLWLVCELLGEKLATQVLHDNAFALYRQKKTISEKTVNV